MYKILVFGMTENPGGVESVIMNYYHYMDKNTFHFDFLCNSYNKIAFEEEIISNGSQTFHFPARSKNYKKYKKELKNFFENNASKYDAIWVNVCILVIALGMISFGIVSAFFYMKRVDVRNYGEQHSRNYISINYLIQLVFLILEVLVVFYHAKYIKDVVAAFGYSTSSIFDIAGKYHVIALFNYNNFIEKAVSASFIYRHGIVWTILSLLLVISHFLLMLIKKLTGSFIVLL